jgi:hypothetical protein
LKDIRLESDRLSHKLDVPGVAAELIYARFFRIAIAVQSTGPRSSGSFVVSSTAISLQR